MNLRPYEDEIQYIIGHGKRNNFIKNLVLDLKGNSLVLFSRVETHGQPLYELINNSVKGKRKVFYVHGGIDAQQREHVREITEKENNAIIVASYGTFSTGINIKNLHNVILHPHQNQELETCSPSVECSEKETTKIKQSCTTLLMK